MQRLLLLGLNHTTAPLEVREKLAFDARQQREAVAAFRAKYDGCEIVLLSTCNRVELYAARPVHASPRVQEIADFLATFHGVPVERFASHLYEKSGRDAAEHLFTVVSSLDSMVLGETQILGQVRQAYEISRDSSAAGAMLNPLFQRAIAVGKEVMYETALGEGRLSIASIAVDYAKRIFESFGDKTVLCIGAGKMTHLALQSFAALRPGRMLVCNRSAEKAEALARRFSGAQAVPFERLGEHLVAADIVITSTGAARPIIDRPLVESALRQRRYRPMFLIDIAVPRDVDAGVAALDHVYLYNLDDLQQVVIATQTQRGEAVAGARAIVAAHVDAFIASLRTRELGPLIDALYRQSHQIAQDELARTINKLPNLADAERAQLEELTRRIVNKLLHDPVRTLRDADAAHAMSPQYLHAMQKLFRLEEASASDEITANDAPPPPPAENS